MRDLLLIAAGGSLGALARHFANVCTARALGTAFPYGTLLVNVVGCFVMGAVAQYLAQLDSRHPPADPLDAGRAFLRFGLAVGFLGALTTFSSLGLETWRLGEDGRLPIAVLNVAANLVIGLIALAGGMALIRAVG